jgi:hypothetical protein
MSSIINATTAGLQTAGDVNSSGTLAVQANGTTVMTVSSVTGVNFTGNLYDNGVEVGTFAQAAFNAANSAATSSSVTAAFNQANSANVLAQSAFNKANTALANTSGTIFGGNLIISGNLQVTGTTTTINVNNVIVNQNEVVAGTITANGGIASTNTSSGSLIVLGGMGVSGNVYANTVYSNNIQFIPNNTQFGINLLNSTESVNVFASAPTSTTNYYVQGGLVQYYTSNATTNWTLNIAFSSGISLNTALSIGQSVTFTMVATQSSTAYYNNAVTIDGVSVSPKWIGGAPSAGNASGLDTYRYAVIKTGSATYTVLASLTQYK